MGKSLIIPGANFSANAIERITEVWYSSEAIESTYENVFLTGTYTTANIVNSVQDKDINMIRVPATESAGSVLLQVLSGQSGSVSVVDSVTIELPKVSEPTAFVLPKTIHVGAGQSIVMHAPGVLLFAQDIGSPYWSYDSGYLNQSSTLHVHGIDYGYQF